MIPLEIAAVAQACGHCATRPSEEAWRTLLSDDGPPKVSARVEHGWLLVRAPAPRRASRRAAWDLLRLNARVGRGARLALSPHDRRLVVLADLPLEDEVDLAALVADAGDGLRALMKAAHAGTVECSTAEPPAVESPDDAMPVPLSTLIRGSPWSFVERSPRRLAVDLDIPGRFSQAVVEASCGRCRASVGLQTGPGPSARARQALGLLLLTLTGTLKMVKASVNGSGEKETPTLEVSFPGHPTPVELNHALAALSIACAEVGAEARVLNSEEIAEAYLAARGRAA
jgi:hypothetical protein